MKKTRKWFSLLLCGVILVTAACSGGQKKGGESGETGSASELTDNLSHDELVEAAKKEGKLTVYAVTSRVSKAAEEFEKKYGIKVEAANLKDGELIEKVSLEVGGKVDGADLVLCQDGARVYGELISQGYVKNYIPASVKADINAENRNPLVFMFQSRVFIYNDEKGPDQPVKNIWEVTESQWKDKIQFKNPNNEGTLFNFLTMVTSDEWAEKIAKAYKDHYGKDIVLTEKNAGYEWIKAFFNNTVLGTSDSTIAENVGAKGQKDQLMGLFVLSKLRYVESKNLALRPVKEMNSFCGYSYPIYAQITANAKNVNAAKLFIEYLMTDEGFAPWAEDIGSYSGNSKVKSNKDDEAFSFWDTRLIRENPQYSFENRAEVEEFVNNIIGK